MGRHLPPENSWDRRPNESDRAWEAFVKFRSLPPGERSYLAVAKVLHKSHTLISGWGNKHNWHDRTFDWDCFVDKQTRTAEIEAIREMRKKHLNMASGFFAVVGIELNKLITLARQNTDLVLSPDQIHRLGDFATRLERMNHDEPTAIVEQRQNVSIDDRREFIQHVLADDTIMGQLEALESKFTDSPPIELAPLNVTPRLIGHAARIKDTEEIDFSKVDTSPLSGDDEGDEAEGEHEETTTED